MMEILNVLSLFSGCGGMDLGFEGAFDVLSCSVNRELNQGWFTDLENGWVWLESTRFRTVFSNDIRPAAMAAWCRYFSERGTDSGTFWLDSILNLLERHKGGEQIFPRNPDVVTGGFPCQDFSVAGKRLGFCSETGHDGKKLDKNAAPGHNRGQLYLLMKEVVSLTKPKVFVAENVKGLTSLADARQVIEKDFASACDGGYLVVPARVLNAACYGVPQNRERVIFFGFRKSALNKKALEALGQKDIPARYDPYPPETHSPSGGGKMKGFVAVREAFSMLEEPDRSDDISQQKYSGARYMGGKYQGQQEVSPDRPAPTIRSEHHGNIEFRRLSREHGGKIMDELEKGMAERRLTVRECARLQTFPDDYHFVSRADTYGQVSVSESYKLIGNAVPPLFAYHIAKRLEKNWELYFGK